MTTRTGTSPTDAVTAKMLRNLFLLGSDLSELPEQLLLAYVDSTIHSGHDVYIGLTAVGMPTAELDAIRQELIKRLRGAIKPMCEGDEAPDYTSDAWNDAHQNDEPQGPVGRWIHRVYITNHFDTGEPLVTVEVNDDQFLGSEASTATAVLNLVRGILTPLARACWRQLVVLNQEQRYVPLDFRVEDMYRRSTTVILPPGLELRRFNRTGDKYDEDPIRRNAYALEHTLKVMLWLRDDISSVAVHVNGNGTIEIVVLFDTHRGMPKAGAINAVHRAICQVVAKHAVFKGFYNQLVIRPAWEQSDPDDGDYDEDAGWLGENREY